MSEWAFDVVRCPSVNVTTHENSTLFLDGPADLASRLGELLSSSEFTSTDVFPFASTTILYGCVALTSLIYVLYIRLRSHGIIILTAGSRGTSVHTRRVSPATANLHWGAYFAFTWLNRSLSAAALHVHRLDNAEAARVVTFVERFCLGASSLCLALALNHQRIYRARDFRAAASPRLVEQVRQMNLLCAILFAISVLSVFIADHIAFPVSLTLGSAMYWVFISALILFLIPTTVAVLWVVLHEAEIQPSRVAKLLISIGVALRSVTTFPPGFWNEHVLSGYVSSNPCPLVYLSVYDVIVVIELIADAVLFIFAITEHRRNALIEYEEHYRRTSEEVETFLLREASHTTVSTPSTLQHHYSLN